MVNSKGINITAIVLDQEPTNNHAAPTTNIQQRPSLPNQGSPHFKLAYWFYHLISDNKHHYFIYKFLFYNLRSQITTGALFAQGSCTRRETDSVLLLPLNEAITTDTTRLTAGLCIHVLVF